MIPSVRKFPLRTEFVSFRAKSKKILSPRVACYVLRVTHKSRLAVIIPKKVNKLAAMRNHLRRLTYDTLWPRIKDSALDVVIVYKPLPLTHSISIQTGLVAELMDLLDSQLLHPNHHELP
jgi:ribonuclease P protein component